MHKYTGAATHTNNDLVTTTKVHGRWQGRKERTGPFYRIPNHRKHRLERRPERPTKAVPHNSGIDQKQSSKSQKATWANGGRDRQRRDDWAKSGRTQSSDQSKTRRNIKPKTTVRARTSAQKLAHTQQKILNQPNQPAHQFKKFQTKP